MKKKLKMEEERMMMRGSKINGGIDYGEGGRKLKWRKRGRRWRKI